MLGLSFRFKFNQTTYIVSIAKTAFKKFGALIHSMKFVSPKVALYLNKSTILSCMEYYCHVWAGAPSFYLNVRNKLQRSVFRTVVGTLAASLKLLVHCRNVASLCLCYGHYFGRCSSELAGLVPRPYLIYRFLNMPLV